MSFYCTIWNGQLQLKRKHQYYHQVQLQLYIGSDMHTWCDFCLFTPLGVAVERIYPDLQWQVQSIPELVILQRSDATGDCLSTTQTIL